jgi:hypothetical protein
MDEIEILYELPAWAGPFIIASVVLTGLTFFAILAWKRLRGPGRS